MKWALRNQRAEKWLNNSEFQVVRFLLYAHYPILFILLFDHYGDFQQSAKIQTLRMFESTTMDLTQLEILPFPTFSSYRVVK